MGRGWTRILAALLWCIAANGNAAISHDVLLNWQTLHSPHFTIHFPEQEQQTARHLLAIAERVHQRLSPLMAWTPRRATEIVLSDESDLPNGWATPLPDDRMTLYLAPPDDIDGLEDHAGWLELVFTHEYLHILHLDKASGAPAVMRRIFGRQYLLFPNTLQPSWFMEGLATRAETDSKRGIGRGQSSYYQMLMRMEALAGVKPLRQINQPIVSWPMGDTPYLYGVYFYQWLADTYGKERIAALVGNYSNNLIPFRIDSNAYQVTGKDLSTLWLDFSVAMTAHFRDQQQAIEARGITAAQPLSHDGYFASSLVAGGNGDLYYAGFDAQRRPALMRWRNGKLQRLADLHFGARLAYQPRRGLLVAQPEFCRNADTYYDLYRYDGDGRHRQRLTHCGRYRNASWSPDGESIVAVHLSGGQSELQLLDAQGQLREVLWQGEQGEVPGALAWSADGRQLATALWQPQQGWNLALFDLQQRQWRLLTHSTAIEGEPRFSADGKQLLFTADYDGVYNIYSLELASGKLTRLTNLLGGAFYPVHLGEQLYFLGYSAAGFDLYQTPYQPRAETVAVSDGPSGVALPPPPAVDAGVVQPYSPWQSVAPRWWFPHLYVDNARTEVGVMSGGSDTLQRHNYAVDLAYDAKNHWGVGSVDYVYDRWTPLFKLHGDSTPSFDLYSDGTVRQVRRETAGVAEMIFPLLHYTRQWAAHLGVVEQRASDARVYSGVPATPALRDRLAGVAFSFNSATQLPRSVSSNLGSELLLVAEDSDLLHGSDYSGRTLSIDWRGFMPLWGEQVLALRGVAGNGDVGSRPFRLGSGCEVNEMPRLFDTTLVNTPFDRRCFALRGYDEGLPQLIGTQMRMASLEYRFPVWFVERGLMSPPVGLHQLHGALFTETGTAWQRGDSPQRYYSSYGAELLGDIVLFYGVPLRLALGYAHGMEKIGSDQYYLRLGAAF